MQFHAGLVPSRKVVSMVKSNQANRALVDITQVTAAGQPGPLTPLQNSQ